LKHKISSLYSKILLRINPFFTWIYSSLSGTSCRKYWGDWKLAFWGHINGQAKDKQRFVLRNIWCLKCIIRPCNTVLALVKATKCHDSKVPTVTFCRSLYHIWGNVVVKHPNIPVVPKEIYDKITYWSAYYFVSETCLLCISTKRWLRWLRFFVVFVLNTAVKISPYITTSLLLEPGTWKSHIKH
jgi:hypothetical protein